jgi:hypothetical protein
MAATNHQMRDLKARGIEELKRFIVIFIYLWAIFGLFVLNQAVILRQTSYLSQGFALINAAILAKVMLIAEDLKLGTRFEHRPLIYSVIYKALVFSILFMLFHIGEEVLVGLWRGKAIAASVPRLGGGTLGGALCVWGILFVSLIPFFAFSEIGRVIGNRQLWDLMFRRRESVPPATMHRKI